MRKEKGITLIALIITIIVLAILVGVTISAISNGLIGKSSSVVDKYKLEQATEKMYLKLQNYKIYQYENDLPADFSNIEQLEKDTEDKVVIQRDKTTGEIAKGQHVVDEQSVTTIKALLDGYIFTIAEKPEIHIIKDLTVKDEEKSPEEIPEGFTKIYTVEQLKAVKNNLAGKYIIMRNLDLSTETNWIPIGCTIDAYSSDSEPFTGIIEGNGMKIYGLTIDSTSDYQGIFGHNTGIIKNIILEDIKITGNKYVGSLIGFNGGTVENIVTNNVEVRGINNYVGGLSGYNYAGTIQNVQVSGSVTGSSNVGGVVGCQDGEGSIKKVSANVKVTGIGDENVGGLAGQNYQATIESCYAIGNVDGNKNVGGLLGFNNSNTTVKNSYATGNVKGTKNIGGLVGYNYVETSTILNTYAIGKVTGTTNVGGIYRYAGGEKISNSYSTPETTMQDYNACAKRKILDLTRRSSYDGWDFENIWDIDEEASLAYLRDLPKPKSIYLSNIEYELIEGKGTLEDPYIITTAEQLQKMNNSTISHYKLAKDIDLTEYTWTPIGDQTYKFMGSLDGDGKTIKNLTINGNAEYQGVFGYNVGTIKNIIIENVSIEGSQYVGGLLGYNNGGTIENIIVNNVSVTGTVKNTGGLIGYNYNGIIEKVQVSGIVNGITSVGGLVGCQSGGSITRSWTNVKTTGGILSTNQYVGGLVGQNHIGLIENCYTIGNVTGYKQVGGVVGFNNGNTASVKNTYALGIMSGNHQVGGIFGYNEGGNISNSYWNSSKTSGIEDSSNNVKGLTEAQMAVESSYNNWDFTQVWIMQDRYPKLRQ